MPIVLVSRMVTPLGASADSPILKLDIVIIGISRCADYAVVRYSSSG